MWRFLAGVAATLVLVSAGLFLWNARADRASPIPAAPQMVAAADSDVELAPPPAASEKTREEKRFARYDKDRNGAIAQGEYLAARRKAFRQARRRTMTASCLRRMGGEGVQKFAAADKDKIGATERRRIRDHRVVRKAKPQARLPAYAASSR